MTTRQKPKARAEGKEFRSRTSYVSPVVRFLWFCAGAVESTLAGKGPEIRQDQHRYMTLGVALLNSATFAALASSYMAYALIGLEPFTAVAFGLFWGSIILTFDRLVVMSLGRIHGARGRWRLAVPRILLAGLISSFMALPIELRIFRAEIQSVLSQQETGAIRDAAIRGRAAFPEAAELRAQIASSEDRVEAARERARELQRAALAESDGSSGTGIVGAKGIYRLKQQAYEAALTEAKALEAREQTTTVPILARLQIVEAEQQRVIGAEIESKRQARTLLAQVEALHQLMSRSWLTTGLVILVALCLLFVELLPLLLKLWSPPGPYDRIHARIDAENELEQRERFDATQEMIREDARQWLYMAATLRSRKRADFDEAMAQAETHPDHARNVAQAAAIVVEQVDVALREDLAKAGRERQPWSRSTAMEQPTSRPRIRVVPQAPSPGTA